ncbi:hypothetical protein KI387_019723 [Taxus chinensis]|uniref:Uncharacterized protein n=1 Tax=Taxus chinensis TaxID=29808 RepID=A0AA38GAM3_TAXCH|nr:hypothetical protein KI387_019723 [Taxus chinensis]
MKTRERKFQPIAAHVNMMHHAQDPIAFPWQWTWKDASTKVQNMRHQYLGVKQKIRKIVNSIDSGEREEYDWAEGLTHWSNFLKYKDVFGDVELDFGDIGGQGNGGRNLGVFNGRGRSRLRIGNQVGLMEDGSFMRNIGLDGSQVSGLLGLGLGFEYDGEEGDEHGMKEGGGGEEYEYEEAEQNAECSRKKKRFVRDGFGGGGVGKGCAGSVESRVLAFLSNQFTQLRERELRREEVELERERERQKREILRAEADAEREREREEWEKEREEQEQMREKEREERFQMWESRVKEREAREQQRREEEMRRESEWEERMEQRRLEWRKAMETMTREHQAALVQLQAQIMQSQQNVITQLLGTLLQFSGQAGDLSDHTGAGNPFVSQILQSLQHCGGSGIVPSGNRGAGGSNDNQFIVDG